MFIGAHLLFYSTDADADRAFMRDVLGFASVDAGGGWLIFRLPPAEAGVHPAEQPFVMGHAGQELLGAVLYLMCDDLAATVRELDSRGVRCAPPVEAEWGRATAFALPSGGSIGLYQPLHPLAIAVDASRPAAASADRRERVLSPESPRRQGSGEPGA